MSTSSDSYIVICDAHNISHQNFAWRTWKKPVKRCEDVLLQFSSKSFNRIGGLQDRCVASSSDLWIDIDRIHARIVETLTVFPRTCTYSRRPCIRIRDAHLGKSSWCDVLVFTFVNSVKRCTGLVIGLVRSDSTLKSNWSQNRRNCLVEKRT